MADLPLGIMDSLNPVPGYCKISNPDFVYCAEFPVNFDMTINDGSGH